jgi:hypothetical protein
VSDGEINLDPPSIAFRPGSCFRTEMCRHSRDSRARSAWLRLTRRWFLLASSAVTLLPRLGAAGQGEPFSDGTWFEDGTGWVN